MANTSDDRDNKPIHPESTTAKHQVAKRWPARWVGALDHTRALRMTMRLVIAGTAAAAVAVGVAGVAFDSTPAAPPAAGAETMGPADAALAEDPSAIVHVAVKVTETKASGARARWSDDAWLGYPLGAPNFSHFVAGFRQILYHGDISVQTGVFGRSPYLGTDYYASPGIELYDASTNTIDELPPVRDSFFCSKRLIQPTTCVRFKAPAPAGCREMAGGGGLLGGAPAAIYGGTKAGDRRVKADELAGNPYLGGPSRRPFFSPSQSVIPDLWSPCLADQVANQVRYRSAKIVGSTKIDGQRVIEYSATDGSWTYYAAARGDKPVRLVVRGADPPELQQGPPTKSEQATLTVDVQTYAQLPFRGNEKLLSLTAQHPGARIDTNTADYHRAQAHLFPTRRLG